MPAPTRTQLEILKYLAVGMHVGAAMQPRANYPILAKGVTVIAVRRTTIHGLVAAGWLTTNYELTPLGRDVTEVKTFVRAFAAGARP